jgi:hypothetical protein
VTAIRVQRVEQNLSGCVFKGCCEVETVVTRWLITQDTGFYRQAKEKFVPRYEKSLNFDGNCLKECRDSNVKKSELFPIELKHKPRTYALPAYFLTDCSEI